jgi:hypothetical protein
MLPSYMPPAGKGRGPDWDFGSTELFYNRHVLSTCPLCMTTNRKKNGYLYKLNWGVLQNERLVLYGTTIGFKFL